ncbi:MAG: DNA topoisomerase IV subunit A [Bacteroides sp.]|nr:DNA topoisomerase IV subunit A [Prevotella sp.]MCM1408385.1 DNA topoisomerase IV subunit A [Treponema brennaborense]MCM1470384.1 DNA topoisomerase IV subunit A [Bacteroides sp.]
MAYVKNLFDKNFIEYASYVIRDRAIPDLEDGLKPVQRRILHTLFEIDDGKYHKVANVVGQCMKYHPHGDASIYGALVVLANKELFIDKQGNFGNIFTGDRASAARYIECRIRQFAKDVLYNPAITRYVPSYDGRGKEPVAFRAKLPLVLLLGAEGIAVGMSTKILSHNIREVIEAEKKCLRGESFQLFPDFPTGALMDVSGYQDGLGKIVMRANMDLSDPKRIIITELPFGSTTETLIASIESAAKAGRVKIASISDYTTDKVEIEIKLQRGVYTQDVVDALYAFTDCEQSISCNLLVIKDNMPQVMTATDVIKTHAAQLTAILKDELELERANLAEKLHLRTLERIFIEERIYKHIEQMKTAEAVEKAVIAGFVPFRAELARDVSKDDVEHLLKIPIRRISLYDINKNRQEVKEILARLKEIAKLLKDLTAYAISYLDGILANLDEETTRRRTRIVGIAAVDAREVVKRDTPLRYDEKSGYLGTAVSSGTDILKVSPYDRVFILRKTGTYSVVDVPDKLFVGGGLWFCCLAEKEELSKHLFTVLYKDPATGYAYIKRCRVTQYIMNRDYLIVPDGMEVLHIDTREKYSFALMYVKKPRQKTEKEIFRVQDFEEKGLKTLGVRLAAREVEKIELCASSAAENRTRRRSVQPQEAAAADAEKNTADKAAAAKKSSATEKNAKSAKSAASKPRSAEKNAAPKPDADKKK